MLKVKSAVSVRLIVIFSVVPALKLKDVTSSDDELPEPFAESKAMSPPSPCEVKV